MLNVVILALTVSEKFNWKPSEVAFFLQFFTITSDGYYAASDVISGTDVLEKFGDSRLNRSIHI